MQTKGPMRISFLCHVFGLLSDSGKYLRMQCDSKQCLKESFGLTVLLILYSKLKYFLSFILRFAKEFSFNSHNVINAYILLFKKSTVSTVLITIINIIRIHLTSPAFYELKSRSCFPSKPTETE